MTYEEALKLVKECGLNITDFYHGDCMKKIKEAMEKQIPKKPYYGKSGYYHCPACNEKVWYYGHDEIYEYRHNYCGDCGQRLDWGDNK